MELNLKMLQAEQAEADILKDLIQKLQTDLQAYPESLAAESIKTQKEKDSFFFNASIKTNAAEIRPITKNSIKTNVNNKKYQKSIDKHKKEWYNNSIKSNER